MQQRHKIWIFTIVIFSIFNMFIIYRYIKSDDALRPQSSFDFNQLISLRSAAEKNDIQTLRTPQENKNFLPPKFSPNLSQKNLLVTQLIMNLAEMYTHLYKKQTLDRKCSTCAVVMSSGRLVNQSAGMKIDESDCVIRMNNAPVTGYEKDVGRRTDIRVVGNANAKFLQNKSKLLFPNPRGEISKNKTNHTLIIMPWLYNDTVNMTGPEIMIAKKLSKQFSNLEFYIPLKRALMVVEDIFLIETGFQRSKLKTWFTTGWQTMLLSLSICSEIHVYGMTQYELCRKSDPTLYHYYEKNGHKECAYYKKSEINLDTGHLFITEKAVFARWAKRYNNIRFHYPLWNLSSVNDDKKLNSPFIHELDLANLREVKRLKRQGIKTQYKVPKSPIYLMLFTLSCLFILIQMFRVAKSLSQMFDFTSTTW
ncbi:alpha-N-acetyl-neuraminyl-2,3-beta-galactosyl-1,3-N-acetyl-galactosaminide alpha-2,6-sialyltransferase-like [Antedon mediterranea]|uniref:alpha-N-acetyl-neuraminyl-2,3-beta-galactosyl-1, 3-N-acetyl-galactosaminide alpha-2,6-sialyltransferase-like n=1 Tax=Antedon mediterranea TaxID=105859 RepID=UPI003AF47955